MRWTESDVDDLRKYHSRGMTDSAIGKLLDRGEVSVGAKRYSLGLTHRRTYATKRTGATFWTPERKRKLSILHEDGWTDKMIASHFGDGCSVRAVAVQRGKQGTVAYRCAPKASIRDYATGTLIAALRERGFDVIVRKT